MNVLSDLKKFPEFRLLTIVLLIISGTYLFKMAWGVIAHFSDLLLLVFLAWLLAFLLEPLILKLMQFSFSRAVSAILVYTGLALVLILAMMLFIPSLASQLSSLVSVLPEYLTRSPAWISRFQDALISALGSSVSLITVAFSFLFSAFVVTIIAFYFSLDRPMIAKEILELVPKDYCDEVIFVKEVINRSFSRFFHVQLIFGAITTVYTWLVMLVLGIQFAVTAAFLAGLLAIIPLVGPILALIPPVTLGFFQEPTKGLASFIILFILQGIQYNIIGPKLFGSAFKIHPLVIFLSFFIGYKVAGAWGSFFAVPVVSILAIIGQELWKHWLVRESPASTSS